MAAGRALGLPVNGAELVTGEHSGLANTKPGNPGVLDPPSFDNVDPVTTTGATLAPGTYFYSVTVSQRPRSDAESGAGQRGRRGSGQLRLGEHVDGSARGRPTRSIARRRRRGAHPDGPWALVAQTTQQNPDTPTDDGAALTPLEVPGDAGRPGPDGGAHSGSNTATVPPTVNTAVMDPYPMNPNFTTGLANASVAITASDASKTYPIETNPTVPAPFNGPQNPAGAAFNLPAPGGRVITTFPRYPTNVYYNASKQGQELDEYNWIYNAGKGCVPIPNVTTCNTADLTWDQYLATERNIVFGHITGNDPRPHYAHQSNFADYNAALPETDPNQGGILYPYLDNILGYYHTLFADNAPITQLTSTDISAALARQQTWAANLASGAASAYFQDNKLHIVTTATMQVPITGSQGDDYAGTKSTWLTVNPGETILGVANPIVVPPVAVTTAGKAKANRPVLSNLKMSTRKFAAARKGLAKRKSRTQISWKLSRVATVKLAVQLKKIKKVGKKKKVTWVTKGTITKKNAKAGTTKLTFTGKLGKHKLKKGSYRLTATATAGQLKSATKTLRFTVVKL